MKNFKEFIPGTGLVSSQNITSPSLPSLPSLPSSSSSSFLNQQTINSNNNNNNLKLNDKKQENKDISLTVTAKEFIPNQNHNYSSYINGNLSDNWFQDNTTQDLTTRDELIEVNWLGNSVYIPLSMADSFGLINNNSNNIHDVTGLEWGNDINCLPTPTKRTLQAVGLPEPLRQHFHSLDLESLRQMEPDDERYKEIPNRYHCAYPLDDPMVQRGTGGSFGYPSSLYKVIDRTDNYIYVLRRFDNVRSLTPSVLKNAQSKWTSIRHSSIITLYSITLEKGAVFFTHAYHSAAQTLKQRYLDPRTAGTNAVTEPLLWRILSQLIVGIKLVHSRGMAVRSISCSHILLTSGARFRIASVGVVDVLEFESRKTIQDMQIEDIIKLGYVILSLAARTSIGPKSIESGLGILQQNFSQELYVLINLMINGSRTAEQICGIMIGKICDELDYSMTTTDALHSNLRNEYENGRILRLLLKLGLINERPEYSLAPSWSETGERYVLQLFRDYLFHQTNLEGVPQLDFGHIISSLNKLDNGDSEQILLCSRDGKDILIVSYSEIRRCMEMSIMELIQQSNINRNRLVPNIHEVEYQQYGNIGNRNIHHPNQSNTNHNINMNTGMYRSVLEGEDINWS